MARPQIEAELEPRLFAREPLAVEDGIPIFSRGGDYTENYERIAGDHLAHFARTGENPFQAEALWRELEASTAALLRRHARPGSRVLDVGVGTGRLLEGFPDLERHGLDISMAYLRIAREKGIAVAYGLVEETPYAPGTFDAVVCTDVLEHVLDLNLAVRQLLAVLRAEGVLIVRVPYREELGPYLDPESPYRFVHLRSFDEHGLRLLFERIFGARVIEEALTGYEATDPCARVQVPVLRQALVRGVRLLGRVAPRLERLALRALFRPIEINLVVRPGRGP